ncbi:MAG: 3-ketoacyl-ACP reductase [Planctomycetes bacterium RBG_16_64_10]|nr:MAG: 3-ketoacyl-ACP reductase [Planctomycetes bacterium RBG_16_64_10]
MTETTSRLAAVVTGASRGIGRAIAVALGAAGYNVAINYRANDQAAREAAARVQQTGAKAPLIRADIADRTQRADLLQRAVDALGPLALLVNNAGISAGRRDDLLEIDPADFGPVMATNLEGPFFLTQQVARHMIECRTAYPDGVTPTIINIGSISAYTASVNRAEYCLAKAAMTMMTKLFAARLAEHAIHVHEIRPGIIATEMTSAAQAKYDRLILEQGLLPIRRWGQPEDVARAVVAIARGALPYSTGTVIDVDGGFHLRCL